VEAQSDRIRVIVAKVGLDGHDRGVKVVARTLRDAGMDVIYTVSILSGAHMTVFPRILESLREKGADDILVIGGGVIPDDDVAKLKEAGVTELMLQDTPPDAIVAMIQRVVAERGAR